MVPGETCVHVTLSAAKGLAGGGCTAYRRHHPALRGGGSRLRCGGGGRGGGLAIVRAICEAHGGTVQALSVGRRRGCTFVITLPAGAQ
jgi:signal transduction histidine kinase